MTPIDPTIWDFVIVATLAAALPAFTAFYTLPRLLRLPRATIETIRSRVYVQSLVTQWLFAGAALQLVLLRGYTWADIGLALPTGNGLLIGAGIIGGLAALLAIQHIRLRRKPEGRALVRHALQRVEWILPRTQPQRRLWWVVSAHAGWGEELMYRGFVFALLASMLPVWAAAGASCILFGLAHAYQGVRGVVLTSVLGGAFVGTYLLTGSLWVPIAAHALYDIHAGELGFWAFARSDDD